MNKSGNNFKTEFIPWFKRWGVWLIILCGLNICCIVWIADGALDGLFGRLEETEGSVGITETFAEMEQTTEEVTTESQTEEETVVETKEQTGGRYSDLVYDGFDLIWTYKGGRDILLSATDENGTISFEYDWQNYRKSKTNAAGETTYFVYESGNLAEVRFGTHKLSYTFDNLYGRYVTKINIDGIDYTCEMNDFSVQKLIDSEGNTVVEYVSEDGLVTAVLGRDESGNMVDKTNDSEFIGNLNRVTYNSYYFDVETGWYYCGRYYDVVNGRFVDGISSSVNDILESIANSGE